jgi:hypothetical protein
MSNTQTVTVVSNALMNLSAADVARYAGITWGTVPPATAFLDRVRQAVSSAIHGVGNPADPTDPVYQLPESISDPLAPARTETAWEIFVALQGWRVQIDSMPGRLAQCGSPEFADFARDALTEIAYMITVGLLEFALETAGRHVSAQS